ncbi:MAG: hypothetical protein U0821_17745 [Chloroflexota bacterium]
MPAGMTAAVGWLVAILVAGWLLAGDRTTPAAAATAAATLDDYWNGRAEWQYVRKLENPAGAPLPFPDGAHIAVLDENWYLFGREYVSTDPDLPCGSYPRWRLGVTVRKSTDRGETWSDPVRAIPPTPGTAWTCEATDGDAFYDGDTDQWHYVFQCVANANVARSDGCHVVRDGRDPLGLFHETHANPVISDAAGVGTDLWRLICPPNGGRCLPQGSTRVKSAGTFDIIEKRDGWFAVSFHGYDGINGFRGIAKTMDFVTWVAADPSHGVPLGPFLGPADPQTWREQWYAGRTTGIGTTGTLFQNGAYYTLADAFDRNLWCTPNQNTDVGIIRSWSLRDTGRSLQQYPLGNPIFYSSKVLEAGGGPDPGNENESRIRGPLVRAPVRVAATQPCSVGYSRLFEDPTTSETYLHRTRVSPTASVNGIHLFKLVPKTNVLRNGDLWRCDADGWSTTGPPGAPPVNVTAPRDPAHSTDNGCAMVVTCPAGGCLPGHAVFQVTAPGTALRSGRAEFGGRVASEGGSTTVRVRLTQLDAGGTSIADAAEAEAAPGSTFELIRGSAIINPDATALRFEILVTGSGGVRLDELFAGAADVDAPLPVVGPAQPRPSPAPASNNPSGASIPSAPQRRATPVPPPPPPPSTEGYSRGDVVTRNNVPGPRDVTAPPTARR